MNDARYFEVLLTVSHYPYMYGVQDVMDLSALLTGYRMGAGAKDSELVRLLNDLTEFLQREYPEPSAGHAWTGIIKWLSWERGGSIPEFRRALGRMLVEQGHWTEEHYETFTSEKLDSPEVLRALPPPQYTELKS
jgi:hypothetical protein